MNWDQMGGRWKQVKGKVREKWGKLTDDDLDTINGKREQLVGTIQRRYGNAKEDVEKQVSEWENQFDETMSDESSRVGSTSYQGKNTESANFGGQQRHDTGRQPDSGERSQTTRDTQSPSSQKPGTGNMGNTGNTGNTGSAGGKKTPPGR